MRDIGHSRLDDYPPVNMQIWPSVKYVLEVSTSVSEDEAIHRQYYGKHIVRLDTIAEERHFSVIYRFTEDGVGETVLFVEDQEYFTHILSHDDFLEMNDSFEALLYPTLPGEVVYARYGEDRGTGVSRKASGREVIY